MKDKAKGILGKGIEDFSLYFDNDAFADCALHSVIGKIMFATELGLISDDEMGEYIDEVFKEHKKVKKEN